LNDDMGHDSAELQFRNFAFEPIARRKFHSQIINADIKSVQEKGAARRDEPGCCRLTRPKAFTDRALRESALGFCS
jgi:hypothetical protein